MRIESINNINGSGMEQADSIDELDNGRLIGRDIHHAVAREAQPLADTAAAVFVVSAGGIAKPSATSVRNSITLDLRYAWRPRENIALSITRRRLRHFASIP